MIFDRSPSRSRAHAAPSVAVALCASGMHMCPLPLPFPHTRPPPDYRSTGQGDGGVAVAVLPHVPRAASLVSDRDRASGDDAAAPGPREPSLVFAFGRGEDGQLGLRTQISQCSPTAVPLFSMWVLILSMGVVVVVVVVGGGGRGVQRCVALLFLCALRPLGQRAPGKGQAAAS
jgi:hypothetical protein